ncbi:MAG: hypothetical protein ACF8R9_01065 [Phycisphaerales bacterium JB054]
MAYPTNYQDAEHRRALNAILDDLHTVKDEQCTDDTSSVSSIDDGDSAQEGGEHERVMPTRADAELQVRTTRLSAVQMATHSTN